MGNKWGLICNKSDQQVYYAIRSTQISPHKVFKLANQQLVKKIALKNDQTICIPPGEIATQGLSQINYEILTFLTVFSESGITIMENCKIREPEDIRLIIRPDFSVKSLRLQQAQIYKEIVISRTISSGKCQLCENKAYYKEFQSKKKCRFCDKQAKQAWICIQSQHSYCQKCKNQMSMKKKIQNFDKQLQQMKRIKKQIQQQGQIIKIGKDFQLDPRFKQIGKGTFSIVYQGRRISDKSKKIAVKVLKRNFDQMDSQDIASYKKQINVMKSMACPGVVMIYDFDLITIKDGKKFVVAMQLMQGTLQELVKKNLKQIMPIPQQEAIQYLFLIIQAYMHIHKKAKQDEMQFIHRDLKPANILYKKDDKGNLLFKVGDLGSSRRQEAKKLELKNKTGNVGTLNYQSPQQMLMKNSSYSEKADVYAIGVIFFQLLTGEVPTDIPLNKPCVDYDDKKKLNQKITEEYLQSCKISRTAIDFIIKCLKEKEQDRINWIEIMSHDLLDKNRLLR